MCNCPFLYSTLNLSVIYRLSTDEHRHHQHRPGVITAVGWNSIYFLFLLFFFFSGDKPATLISHCCQLNSTLSCNYFQYISIHISFRCHPNKIYKGSVVQSLICSTDPKTSTRIHIHTHTHTQASSHHPAHGVLKWELWRFLWNKKK